MTITAPITTAQDYKNTNNYVTNVTKNDTSSKTDNLNKLSFEITPNSTINPIDISFEEYKTLSYDDISTMYYSSNKTSFSQAVGLWKTATSPGDPILMKTAYEMDIETFKNDPSEKNGMGSSALFWLGLNVNMKVDENGFLLESFELNEAIGTHAKGFQPPAHLEHNTNLHPKEEADFTYDFFLELEQRLYNSLSRKTEAGKQALKDFNVFENIHELKMRYEEKTKENEKVLGEYLRR